MDRENLARMDGLIDEVVRELKQRMYQSEKAASERSSRIRTLVVGEVTRTELRALESFAEVLTSPDRGDWDILLAAQLPVRTMAYTALLLPDENLSKALIQGLLEGKKVYLLESGLEYRGYRRTASKTLYQKYQEYEDILRRYGCEIVSDVLTLADYEGNSLEETPKNHEETGVVCNLEGIKLLKESDLNRVRKEGCIGLLIGKNTIITPLAQDYITNHNLVIQRK